MPVPARKIIDIKPTSEKVEIMPATIDEDDLDSLLVTAEDKIKGILDTWLDDPEKLKWKNGNLKPRVPEDVRQKLVKAISLTIRGTIWGDVKREVGIEWFQISSIIRGYTDTFGRLWELARRHGEDTRRELRLGESHKRAVEGWDEPVYFQGVQCGQVRKFSDRLMELLLRGDDPVKFGKADQPNINIQTNLLMQQLKGTDCSTLIKRQE